MAASTLTSPAVAIAHKLAVASRRRHIKTMPILPPQKDAN